MDVTISPLSFERWPSLENLFGRTGGLERVLVRIGVSAPAAVTGPERTTSATSSSRRRDAAGAASPPLRVVPG
jgi:hypothetical protein